jgi:hypothetical protein
MARRRDEQAKAKQSTEEEARGVSRRDMWHRGVYKLELASGTERRAKITREVRNKSTACREGS